MDDEGEEEEGSIAAGLEEDSSSEGSAISDADDDADAEGSEVSELGTPKRAHTSRRNGTDKQIGNANGKVEGPAAAAKKPSLGAALADTEAMMNGMNMSGNTEEAEEIHFDEMGQQGELPSSKDASKTDQSIPEQRESLIDRRKREHEEYKKKRDADPAFVPNRGGFFMHDHRSIAPGQNGFRPSGRGRGRGRGGIGGSFSPSAYVFHYFHH